MKNQPYNVLRHNNQFEVAPRVPAIAGSIISALGITSTLGTFIVYGLTYIGVSLITSAVLRALAPKPPRPSAGSQGILVNSREPDAPHQFVYGQMRKGGTITYLETTGENNKFLHMIVALAGHECEEIGDIYIDDSVVTLDASGNVTDAFLDGEGASTIRVQKFDGSQTTAPADLLAESELTGADALDANFVGNGIAYLYVRLRYDQNAFPNGIPLFTAVVKGKKVYDPRTTNTVWSENAALCIRDYITSAYGLGDSEIDDITFAAAANICDEAVPLSGLGEVSKYTVNGIITSDTSHGEALDQMITSCGGTLFWGAGKWKLTVADYIAPTKTLTLDDLRSGISLKTRSNLRDQFNIVQGTFVNKDARWITQDYPAIIGAGFITEDNGFEQPIDLELPFTTDSATAQRLAKLTLYRGREQLFFSAEFGMNAFDVEVGEIIQLDIDRYGWTNKEFEVVGWQLKPSDDGGDLRVSLSLRETSAAAFSWDAEESDIIGNDTNLPDPFAGLTINNLTASGGGRTQGDGTFINSAILNWDNVANAFLDYYEVEWKPLSDSVYSSTTTEQSDIEISPVIDGVEYIFRVRAVTVAGIKGPYATVQFTGGGDETAPALPTDITATGHFEYISIRWTNPADTDLNYIEIYENDTNDAVSSTKIGISGGDSFQRTNLGLNVTKWYFLKAVDYSGNKSDFTTGVSATTTYLDDPDFENGIYSLFTEQGLYAIEDYTDLPLAGDFVGQKAFNRTDGKLYDWNGTAWEPTVADVAAGSITETEIADNAISTPKLQANSIIASKIAGSTITGDKIVANTITGGLLATSGIITNSAQINDAVIERAKIQDLAVDTIKVANDAITRQDFVQFATQSGSGPYVFSFNTNMTFAGSIIAVANLSVFGTASDGSSATYQLFIDGVQKSGINFAGQILLGLHTLAGGADVGNGVRNIEVRVSNINWSNPSASCNLTVLKRFK